MAAVVGGDVPHPLAPGRTAEGISPFALSNVTEQTWTINGVGRCNRAPRNVAESHIWFAGHYATQQLWQRYVEKQRRE